MTDTPAPTSRSASDILLGALGAAAVLFALVLWLRPASAPADTAGPPPLELVEPSEGATLANPVSLVFRTPVDLRPDPSGWGTGELHIHASVDGAERMAGHGEIERLGGGAYRWGLGTLPAGDRRIRLFWSGVDHRAVPGGASVTVRVRDAGQSRN